MASWRYDGLDRSGAEASGVVVASDRASALRLVQSRGLTPLKIESDDAPTAMARPVAMKSATCKCTKLERGGLSLDH